MPNPKRRHSKRRIRNVRAQHKLTAPSLVECPNCHALHISHEICASCGHYKGRQVISVTKEA